jgi:hypothetical protein
MEVEMKELLKKTGIFSVAVLLLLLAAIGFIKFLPNVSFTVNAQTRQDSQVQKSESKSLRKSAVLDKNKAGDVSIALTNIRADDLINIHLTQEAKVQADVLTVGASTGIMPNLGTISSESSLQATADTITFDRPDTSEKIVLNIQVPPQTKVEVTVNGDHLLNSRLESPIAISDGKIVEGSKNMGTAIMKASFPGLKNKKIDSGPKMLVQFSQLEVLRKAVPENNVALPQVAYVEIDDKGLVQKVSNIDGTPVAPEVEKALRKWEFAVYKKNDQPTNVITAIKSSDW